MIQVAIKDITATSTVARFYCDTEEEAKEARKWCRAQLHPPYNEVEIYRTSDWQNNYGGPRVLVKRYWIYSVVTNDRQNLMLAKLAFDVMQDG